MGKFIGILLTMFIVEVLFAWSGFIPAGISLVKTFGDPSQGNPNIESNTFYVTVIAVFTIIIGTGIIGAFTGMTIRESFLLGTLVSTMLKVVLDIFAFGNYIVAKSHDPFGYISALLFSCLGILYIFSAIEWWRGSD